MRYCTYNAATGEILRWTSHLVTPPEGHVCEERDFDVRDGYIDDGAFTPRPPRPDGHRWNSALKRWEDARTSDQKWTAVKAKRLALLRESDWVVTRAAEEGTPVPKEWRDYRKALRDITTQPDPDAITWPEPPSA